MSLDTAPRTADGASPRRLGGTLDRPAPARQTTATPLPSWPLTALFGFYAAWWALGVIDVILIPIALVMVVYLVAKPGTRAPRGFGLWLLFLLWSACSVIEVRAFSSGIGFGYRWLVYASATAVFVYVYNARSRLTARYVLGLLTVVWLTTVVGGFLGVLLPNAEVQTPMVLVADGVKAITNGSAAPLINNELIQHMIVRQFAQHNGGTYFSLAPRPSAPFRFTNNWGNVYSILLPLVVAYSMVTTRLRRRLLLFVALPLSVVPALLTLNRGMFLGIGIAMLYSGVRLLRMGRPKPLLLMLLAAVVALAVFTLLGIDQRIQTRLAYGGNSNETRSSLYGQALASVPDSPLFGYGVPKGGDNPNAPPVGTQGQVWMILVSHGPIGLASAMGWLTLAVVQSRRRRDTVGLATHTSLLVGTIELLYYGVLPYGLPIMMCSAALALRPPDDEEPDTAPEAAPVSRGSRSWSGSRPPHPAAGP